MSAKTEILELDSLVGPESEWPMSVRALEAIVGRAVVSERFRAGILNGKRAELIGQFSLEPEEKSAVLSIQAHSLPEFAEAIEKLTAPRNLVAAFAQDAWQHYAGE